MNVRLVGAARQLITQVHGFKPHATWTPGEPDGIARIRAVRFDRRTSRWLAPLLEAIDDQRIDSVDDDDGRLWVRFVTDSRADSRAIYPLAVVATIIHADPHW